MQKVISFLASIVGGRVVNVLAVVVVYLFIGFVVVVTENFIVLWREHDKRFKK